MAEKFAPKLVLPAVNTNMLGMPQEHAVWLERCVACGDCRIGLTGGICPVVRCSKSLMNGPCGGSHDGLCEVKRGDEEIECAWALIHDRLKEQGREELMLEIRPPKDWSLSSSGGPRKMVQGGGEAGMSATEYKAGSNLEKILTAGTFAVTGECGPPKSADGSVIAEQGQAAQGLRRRRQHHRQPDRRGAHLLHGLGLRSRSRTASRPSCR